MLGERESMLLISINHYDRPPLANHEISEGLREIRDPFFHMGSISLG